MTDEQNPADGVSPPKAIAARKKKVKPRWLTTSKPTEWISSIATLLGVITAIVTGFLVLNTGLLDAKRSEMEAKRAELSISTHNLQENERELMKRSVLLDTKIAASQATINELQSRLQKYEREAKAFDVLRGISNPFFVGDNNQAVDVHVAFNEVTKLWNVAVQRKSTSESNLRETTDQQVTRILNAIGEIDSVDTLSIDDIRLSTEHIEAISKLSKLRSIGIRGAGLDDKMAQRLRLPKNLTSLDISRNLLTKVQPHWKCDDLLALEVEGNSFIDDGLKNVASSYPKLRMIGLADTKITDSTLDSLHGLEVSWLELNGTTVTPLAVNRFVKLPRKKDCAIMIDEAHLDEEIKKIAGTINDTYHVIVGVGRPNGGRIAKP